jgi:hypothetical protein
VLRFCLLSFIFMFYIIVIAKGILELFWK